MYTSTSIVASRWLSVREATGEHSQDRAAASDSEHHRAVERLRGLALRLRLVMAVVQVCVAALRHQNADCDAEVAHVLQRHAGDRLDIEIEQLDALIRRMERAAELRFAC